ncbi:MarR family transcriptional regulator (plasmid) [Clostridium estertheticum]|uniref:MarR family winged helix-turn-helix transcriptional regulator n=1 Tax=Clostridium estertheticum TaxID=238834 RepID=UPI001CF5E84D|nr:MarR family transcriptional regulator [Clostridium estertheticum]MCB2307384.1 MarR family transcriptional regulator [Clostridium estertheticum]MCB2345034.1 MarR family transcriptional regulator [Clostridium estertheticum]WAG48070.1 MarR family transcriptional regulator [Clostridium estertheticum]
MINLNFDNKLKISYTLLRLATKFSEIDKQTSYYGTDKQLFYAEIHMIKAIKENEGIHVTGIAEKLGVTKGAVSQITIKLQKKGMIIKEIDPHNLSKLILRLTPKGEIAHIHHEKIHQEFDNIVKEVLKDASEEQVVFLKKFLNSLEEKIDTFDIRKK